jgi:hypothetical protein
MHTDYLRKQSAGIFRSHVPQDTVDCDDLLGKSFRLDGEEWEVIEADASSGLVKYARIRERKDDMEEEVSSEEIKEATPEEECALRACESVEATAAEVDALVRQDGEAVTSVEYSPGPDVRLIRSIWAQKGVLERVRGVKFMWGCLRATSCCTGVLTGLTLHRAPAAVMSMSRRGM